jgi:lipid II:glycine glycyltransferase (peptidoglycan interpeptide bridge formation enzyme)
MMGEEKTSQDSYDGEEPVVQENDEGALKENQRALALDEGASEGPPKENRQVVALADQKDREDETLFKTGLFYATSGNTKKDYAKSLHFFKKLIKDFPQSSLVEPAKILLALLQENEKLKQSIENLNQMIEKSKQVDIQIEEKKREQKGPR